VIAPVDRRLSCLDLPGSCPEEEVLSVAESNGEKTEKPTGKRLEEASRLGQFARTPEVNTVMALVAAVLGMKWFGSQVWSLLMGSMTDSLSHLGGGLPTELSIASQFIEWLLQLARISGSIVLLYPGCPSPGFESRPAPLV
jgi:flagellar biosynthesis protein FlhB